MKKKIKDLTLEEKKAICNKALSERNICRSLGNSYSKCNVFCPLANSMGFCKAKRDIYGEEEIEVEEK